MVFWRFWSVTITIMIFLQTYDVFTTFRPITVEWWAMFPPDFSVADSTMKGQEHWITALPGWILLTRAASCGVSKRALLWTTVTCSNSTVWMRNIAEALQNTTKFHHIEPIWHDVCWLNDVEVRSTSQNISNLDWIRYSVTTIYLNAFCKQAVIHMASARTLTWNVRQEASRCLGSSYTIWIDHSLCRSWTNGCRKISKTCFRHRICCGLECWGCLNRIELGELFKDVLFTT